MKTYEGKYMRFTVFHSCKHSHQGRDVKYYVRIKNMPLDFWLKGFLFDYIESDLVAYQCINFHLKDPVIEISRCIGTKQQNIFDKDRSYAKLLNKGVTY